MIRIIIFALLIGLVIYMFRHHDKVKENLDWIIGTYVLVGVLLIFFAVKSELDVDEQFSPDSIEKDERIERGPVIGDAPVRKVDTQRPVRFTRDAKPLDEFMDVSCPTDRRADGDDLIRIGVEIKGYDVVNVKREKLASAIWYLYRLHERILELTTLPAFDVNLHVYRELVAYERLRQETLLALPHDQTGFSIPMDKLAVINAQQTPDNTMKAALHQSYHVLAHTLFGKTFPWFYEGMSFYFETMVIDESKINLPENRRYVPMMTGSYSKFNVNSIPLRELLTMSPRIFYDAKKDLNLAAAHSFVNFMLNHDEQGARLMQRYMRLLIQTRCERPEPAAEFFERYYPGGLKQLQQRWREHAIPGNMVRTFEFVK